MNREEYLKEQIRHSGYNLKDFAAKINMPYSTLLSIINKSVGGAALDNVIKICNGLNINIETLNPYDKNTVARDMPLILSKYEKLNTIGKAKADEYIEDLQGNPKYTEIQKTISEDISEELKQDIPTMVIDTK